MTNEQVVSVVAAILLAADRIRETIFYSSDDAVEWNSTSHEEALEEAQQLVQAAQAPTDESAD